MHPLKSYSERHHLSLARMAARIGVADSTLHRLMRLQRRPSGELMAKIEVGTDGEVTAAELFRVHFLPLGQNVTDDGAGRNGPSGPASRAA
jgi:transcriptional regulator with XRE-family HTH domain